MTWFQGSGFTVQGYIKTGAEVLCPMFPSGSSFMDGGKAIPNHPNFRTFEPCLWGRSAQREAPNP